MERAALAIGSGVFVAVLGILIRYAGWMELVAGYDPDRVADEQGLADFVGANAVYVALLTILLGVLEYVSPGTGDGRYWLVYVVAVLGLAVRMVRGARRYESVSGDDADA